MAKSRIPPSIEPIEDAGGPALIALRGGDDPDSPYRLGSREYDWHSHVRGQLFCVESGLVRVRTSHGSWLLPPQRAGWIPPGSAIGPASAARPAAGASSSRPPPARRCRRGLRDRHQQRADAGAGAPGRDVDRPARTGAARGPHRRRPAGRDPARAARAAAPAHAVGPAPGAIAPRGLRTAGRSPFAGGLGAMGRGLAAHAATP